MKLFFLLIMLFHSLMAMAMPSKIQMVFLSPAKTSDILNLIDRINEMNQYKKMAQAEIENCVPMGDGCFHPQYGYIEKKDLAKKEKSEPKIIKDEEMKLKTFNAIETNLVNCDKNYYFDIYCGKANQAVSNSEIEIWFDISSSLRTVDYNKDPNFCGRRTFLEEVMRKCKSKVSYSIYNTSLKQGGEASSVCMSYGTNDEKRLITWMKDSKAKKLYIVTDIDEMSQEMRSFLDENGAKIIGDGTKAFTSSDLINYANELIKDCK